MNVAPRTLVSAPSPSKQQRRTLLFAGLALGILAGVLATVILAHLAAAGGAALGSRILSYLTGRTTTIDVSSPSVVEKIRKLARLETVVYSIDKIVEGQRENAILPDFLTGDKLLLVAHGEVIAGVDLSQLQTGDVSVSGDTVRIKLPSPQILTTRIDNKRTRVYSRTTGLLVAADPNLESEVRQAAEQQIAQAATSDGILDRARQNAQASVTTLLYSLGFRTVNIS